MKRLVIALLLTAGVGAEAQTMSEPANEQTPNALKSPQSQVLSVMISSFKAVQEGRAVRVMWRTTVEINHAGFNLHRRSPLDLSYVRLNPTLLSEGRVGEHGIDYEFVDIPPRAGVYMYQLEDINLEGYSNYSQIISIEVTENITEVDAFSNRPRAFRLYPNYPNPFNPSTTIAFDLPIEEAITLSIFDLQGRLVEQIMEGKLSAGRHEAVWNAVEATAGVYYVVLRGENLQATRSITLVK